MDSQIRDSRGVAIRRDGRGDQWAAEHRRKLGNEWHLRDGDQTHRVTWEIECSEDRTFAEMCFDSYKNRGKLIRNCGTLCRVDRKATIEAAERDLEHGSPALAHLLSDCRRDRASQDGIGGRAFLVCGRGYPYVYVEVNVDTGEIVGRTVLEKDSSWIEMYESLGLARDRARLEHWLITGEHMKEATHGR